SLLVLDHVFIVGVEQERERRAIDSGGRLDYPRPEALLALLVEVGQILAAELGVLIQIVAAALGDSLELAPSERVAELDVSGAARVVRQLVGGMRTQLDMIRFHTEFDVPVKALIDPVVEPSRLFGRIGRDEKFHFHLLEFARAEDEIAGCDFVAERFADLRHAERQLYSLR